jgi:putative transposase
MIKLLSAQYPIARLCAAFEVSRSGYYASINKKKKPGSRAKENCRLVRDIRRLHEDNRCVYGSPRMARALRNEGWSCGENRVARLMRAQGIRALQKRRFRPRTTIVDPHRKPAPNRLKQIKAPATPDRVWVADITYIPTRQGWLYLALVMDLCSRRIVGWQLDNHLKETLVTEALKRALKTRRPPRGLMHHSDRGCQYTSSAHRRLLKDWNISASMSAAGYCYDNAAMESCIASLKTELLHNGPFITWQEAHHRIFDYIETFYNRRRLHSALKYQSPVDFELNLNRN